jgi:sialic acid synthase SpsE
MGNMRLARELVRQAHEAGADLIKGQAFLAKDITTGSMPQRFYETCALSEDQYLELIEYARGMGSDMFYSIFSEGFTRLRHVQKWTKFAASQHAGFGRANDTEYTVVSYPAIAINSDAISPKPRRAWAMYATPYLPPDPALHLLDTLTDLIGGPVGLSDHTKSFHSCLKAIRNHGVNCIEKHFTLQKDVCWDGVIFRDTVHGATPRELEIIANALH